MHKKAIELQVKPSSTFINTQEPILKNEYNADLCNMMIGSNIPLQKLESPLFKKFLQKYTAYATPDRTTITKYYGESLYNQIIAYIRSLIIGKYIWVSIDETTDAEGRHPTAAIIGILSNDTYVPLS